LLVTACPEYEPFTCSVDELQALQRGRDFGFDDHLDIVAGDGIRGAGSQVEG
jgi:hypothetical protein